MVARHSCIIFILCITLLFGCHISQSEKTSTSENRTLITSENLARIAGMQWILQKMTIDGKEYKLSGKKPFIKFENNGKVSGFASINRFFGSMEIDDQGSVKWTAPFGSTRMAGPPELMEQEKSFLNALQKTESFSVERIYLYIQASDGQTKLIFYVPVEATDTAKNNHGDNN